MKLSVSHHARLRFALVYSSLAALTFALTSCGVVCPFDRAGVLCPIDETCALNPCAKTCLPACRGESGPGLCTAAVAECHPEFIPDADADAGWPDSPDAGGDAAADAGPDADTDAGSDAGPDAGAP